MGFIFFIIYFIIFLLLGEELEKFRKLQEEKMTKEERERLNLEKEELNDIMRRWESQVYELHKKQ